jgi:hypothetical protein
LPAILEYTQIDDTGGGKIGRTSTLRQQPRLPVKGSIAAGEWTRRNAVEEKNIGNGKARDNARISRRGLGIPVITSDPGTVCRTRPAG